MELEAIDVGGITVHGKEMLQFPTHPRIAHMLQSIAHDSKGKKSLATDIAALLEERDPMPRESGADISLRLDALRKWRNGDRVNADKNVLERIERLAANWRKLLNASVDNTLSNGHETGELLVAAYPERIARQQQKQSEYYTLSNGRVARLPNHDPLIHEPWLCIAQLDLGQKEGKIFLAASVGEKDLFSRSNEIEVVGWDEERSMVTASVERRVGGLLLDRKPVQKIPEEEKNRVLLEVIRAKGLKLLRWSDNIQLLQARIQCLRTWRPDEGWPDLQEEKLLATLELWLTPYLTGIYKLTDLEKLDTHAMLMNLLPWVFQNKLEQLTPTHLTVPSGSRVPIQYFSDGRPPVMEVRLQEMFGLSETPAINETRTKILLHLLSPGYKPVQVTQDLKSFWHTAYHEVRKELRMRYPKHSWPEDPWTAQPIRGAKKRH